MAWQEEEPMYNKKRFPNLPKISSICVSCAVQSRYNFWSMFNICHCQTVSVCYINSVWDSLTARFMGPTWGPSGADMTQVGLMLAPWTLLSGIWGLHSKLGSSTWSNLLITDIYPAASARRPVLMRPPYKNNIYTPVPGAMQIAQWRIIPVQI